MVLCRVHLILIVRLIVTQTTGMKGPLADRVRALQLTRPQIVLAAQVAWLKHSQLLLTAILIALLIALLPAIIRSSYIVIKLQTL